MAGIWNSWPINGLPSIPQMKPNSLGMFYTGSATQIAEITDGTSNTFLIAETAHGMIAPSDQPWWHHWFAGDHGDTEIDAMYAPNPERKYQEPYAGTYYTCTGGVGIFFGSATSFHPGGVNIAFADGSVHFIKDTINSWAIVPGHVGSSGRNRTHRGGRDLHLADGPGHATGSLPEARNPSTW